MPIDATTTDWFNDARPPERFWFPSAATDVALIGQSRLERIITELHWLGATPQAQAQREIVTVIQSMIDQLKLPPVSAIALSHQLAPDLFVGLHTHFGDGRARIYALHRDGRAVPLLIDFWPTSRA